MKKLINAMDEFGFCPKYELTATGKELVEKVEKETDYHFDKVVKGTIRFIPNEPEDDTSRWITTGLLQPTDVVSVKVVSLSEVGQRKTFKIGWTVIRKPVMIERCGYNKKMYNMR